MTFHPSDLFGWRLLLLSFSVMGFAVVKCFVIATKWKTPELTKQFMWGFGVKGDAFMNVAAEQSLLEGYLNETWVLSEQTSDWSFTFNTLQVLFLSPRSWDRWRKGERKKGITLQHCSMAAGKECCWDCLQERGSAVILFHFRTQNLKRFFLEMCNGTVRKQTTPLPSSFLLKSFKASHGFHLCRHWELISWAKFFFFFLMEYKQKWSALKKIIRKESWKFLCKRTWLTTQSVSHFRSVSVNPSKVDLGVFLVLGTAKSMYVSCPKGRGEKLFLTSLLGLSVQGFTQEVTWKGLWIPFTVHSDLMITVDWTYKICSAGNSPCSVAV